MRKGVRSELCGPLIVRFLRIERSADILRSRDPTFDAMSFGNKFQDPRDLAWLREGLRKAGIYSAER